MKAVPEYPYLFARGDVGTLYCRRRIPEAIRAAYPSGKREITCSLGTSDISAAVIQLRLELVKIDAEFDDKRRELEQRQTQRKLRRLQSLSDEQVSALGRFWVRQVLLTDDESRVREELDEASYANLQGELVAQRDALGSQLARGSVQPILPALHQFLQLCGLDVDLSADDSRRVGLAFLKAVVEALDHRLARLAGKRVEVDTVAPAGPIPSEVANHPAGNSTWDTVFKKWVVYVPNRPRPTIIAATTAWRDLIQFAAGKGVRDPAHVTPQLMTAFVDYMQARGLAVETINGRLERLRAIFKIAFGKHALASNPAENTLGVKESAGPHGREKRLSLTPMNENRLFGSPIFTQHLRSEGQSGEACYWIPLLVKYGGVRPEEAAGLLVEDIKRDPRYGWFIEVTDLPTKEDADLEFDDDDEDSEDADIEDESEEDIAPEEPRRWLKNIASRRKVPLREELKNLRFLEFVEHVRQSGATRLFPTLTPDFHGKLSGTLGKFIGRHMKDLGIVSKRQVLYSLRHSFKDRLEEAAVETKYLKRLMGHASGDGAITDGYGSDVPLRLLAKWMRKLKFPPIPALPWEPGKGTLPRRNQRTNKATNQDNPTLGPGGQQRVTMGGK